MKIKLHEKETGWNIYDVENYSKELADRNIVIEEGAVIEVGAVIREGAWIEEGAWIGKERKNVHTTIVINGIGSTKKMTGFLCDDGPIITIGCMNGYKGLSPNDTRKEVAKKYKEDHPYFAAIDLIEVFLNYKLTEQNK